MKLLLQRYVSALAIVLIAFSAYALLAVPRIEPQVKLRASSSPAATKTSSEIEGLLKSHRQRISHLFPPGSWQLAQPKVLETEQGTMLFKDYKPLEDGRMQLQPLTLILYPGKPDGADDASARPLILDTPDGAVLQFDGATDPARADFGRLKGGLLAGEVKIHSPPTTATANDALSITTRNVQLDERRIWTPHAVNFHYGSSYGSGRDLVVTLLPSDKPGKSSSPSIKGVKTLELVHLDKLHIETAGASLLPNQRKPAAAPTANKAPPAPVEVMCQGPFLFDFVQRVASFEDNVDVIRLNPDGPSDQLNCQLLSIYFKPREAEAGATAPADPDEQTLALDVDRVVAVGHPVVLRAPSMGATARGERLEYHMLAQRIVLEDRERVTLIDERFDIEARQLEYELAPNGGLGRLWAAGPGRLRARKIEPHQQRSGHSNTRGLRSPVVPIAARPQNQAPTTMEAFWHKELRLRPHNGQHVVSLLEQASVGVTGMGGFGADEIHLWLNELPVTNAPAARKPSQLPGAEKLQIEPDRMLAIGQVKINATQFEGETNRLEVWFRNVTPIVNAAPGQAVAPAANPNAPPLAAAPQNPLAREGNTPAKPTTPTQKFHLLGEVVRVQLLRSGETTTLDEVTVERQVRLWDEPLARDAQPQLIIAGDALSLRGGLEANAVVRVVGEPATVTAQGMTMRGGNVNLHRGDNRMWIEGAGDMELPLTSDLSGQKLEKPTNVLVGWREGLEFDGSTAHFSGNVQVQTANRQQWARGDTLDVTLTQRIDFMEPKSAPKAGTKPQVEKIAFTGNFALENHSYDPQGQLASIDKMHAQDLRIDQQTGLMNAAGPGWVSTVRLGGASNPLSERGLAARPVSTQPRSTPAEPQFSYLFVEFQRQIAGNLFQRQVEFQRHVRTIYGPVSGWQDTLSIDLRPEQLNEQTVLLECQRLELRQMPGSYPDTTTVELDASGDTVVEGRGFTARAARIGYQDEKQLLVLEGDGRQDAELTRQTRIGGPQSHLKARKIMYWRFDNRVEVDDARMLDLQQLNELRPK